MAESAAWVGLAGIEESGLTWIQIPEPGESGLTWI